MMLNLNIAEVPGDTVMQKLNHLREQNNLDSSGTLRLAAAAIEFLMRENIELYESKAQLTQVIAAYRDLYE